MNVKIALLQMSMTQSHGANIQKALNLCQEAAKKGANIICLPEVFASPYFPQYKDFKFDDYLEKNNSTVEKFQEIAKKTQTVIVLGSLFVKEKNGNFNIAYVIDADGKLLGGYEKTHIPHDPQFFEQNYFAPGETGFKVFTTKYGKIAPLICYDQWFPEAARAAALAGAEILVYPTAIGIVDGVQQTEGNWQEAWEAVQRGHAVANSVAVATINRVGTEDEMKFWGGSFLYDQFGTLIAHANDKEGITIGEINLELQKQVREGWRFMKERRPHHYAALTDKKLVHKK